MPAIARLFRDGLRAEAEVEKYACAMFLERDRSQDRGRVGVLIVMRLFERQAAIVADASVREHLTDAQVRAVSAKMIPLLAGGMSRRQPWYQTAQRDLKIKGQAQIGGFTLSSGGRTSGSSWSSGARNYSGGGRSGRSGASASW